MNCVIAEEQLRTVKTENASDELFLLKFLCIYDILNIQSDNHA